MTAPAVSVVMPSYNHAQFIGEAISTVLNQTFGDLELIIVDDGSTDQSPAMLSAIADSRVRVTLFEENRGSAEAVNTAIGLARGEYVGMCNSDDRWLPQKLEVQLPILLENPQIGVVFSDAAFIDADGQTIANDQYADGIFRQPNRSRQAWLRRLLERGNCLCHPSSLGRLEIYRANGPYTPLLKQLGDLNMWLTILRKHEIFVLDEKLVEFRIHGRNTSAASPEAIDRMYNETRMLLARLIEDITDEEFIEVFGTVAPSDDVDGPMNIAIEKALYLLNYDGPYAYLFGQLGQELLFKAALKEASVPEILLKNYGRPSHWFHKETGKHSVWLPTHPLPPAEKLAPPPPRPPDVIVPTKEEFMANITMSELLATLGRRVARKVGVSH